MKRSISLLLLSFLMVFAFACKSSQPAAKTNWERLGQREVNFRADHDEIMVTARDGAFTALKLRIRNAPIHIKNVRVVFGNGESRNFTLDRKFAAGAESRVLDLPGNKRVIKKVVFNYRSVPNRGRDKAIVVLWGRH